MHVLTTAPPPPHRCDAQRGTPNPFAAGKMRDRMRGNLYPFLPLTDQQMVAAFERELEERAKLYKASRRPVELFWMPEFAKLIIRQRGADAEAPRMRAVVEAATATAAARAVGALGPSPPSSPSSSRTGNDGKSLRKRIEELMRLDERSVERLYARAADACARNGARLARLMLHVLDEVPDVTEFCEPLPTTASSSGAASVPVAGQLGAGLADGVPNKEGEAVENGQLGACLADGATASSDAKLSSCGAAAPYSTASPSLLGTPSSPSTASEPTRADSDSRQPTSLLGTPSSPSTASEPTRVDSASRQPTPAPVYARAHEIEAVTEAVTDLNPDYARMAADVALSLQTRTHAAQMAAAAERHREREAALSVQHAHELTKLTERVAELEARLLTWQLTCAVLLVLTTALLFGMGHVIIASALSLVRMAALATSVVTLLTAAAYVVVSALCFAGSAPACALEAALLEAARWAWWALSWAWQLLSVALGALSGGARLCALALALWFGRSVRRAHRVQRDKDAGMQVALSAALSAQALESSTWRQAEAQLHAQLSMALREIREIEEEAEAVGARHGAQPVAASAALGGAAGAATRAAAASESGAAAVLSPPTSAAPTTPTAR